MLPSINLPFIKLAASLGASVDELKLIASFLFSYPLAAVLKRLPDNKPWQKNAFSIAVSLFYLVGLFDLWAGLRTVLISSAGAYLIASKVAGPWMPWLGFVFLMGHMSVSHIYRQFVNDPSLVDITGLLDFAGYVLFFPSLFAGPAFDYVDYRQWIEATMFDVPPGTDPAHYPKTRKKRKIPRSGTPAAIKAVIGLFWILAFLQFSSWYNASLVLGDSYMQHGFLRRVWLLEALGLTTRMKYYGVWALTEGACILSGMGYKGINPKTGKIDWNRLQNVNPWGIETAQNSRAYLENWNMNTNNWLRYYMYLRVTPKGKKPGFRASLATFVTSAFWHGFYPGYYLSFVLAAFLQTIAKNFRRHVRPFFLTTDGQQPTKYKVYYDLMSYIATQTAFCFTTAPFVLLTLPDSILVWARVYFYTVIGVILSTAFFASPGKLWLIKRLKARNQSAVPKAQKEKIHQQQLLGLPEDPGADIGEVVAEIKSEVEARQRRGSKIEMPTAEEMRKIIGEKTGKKLD
ncbi:uncharacterized protein KY384_003684 [Bacidia gigantensis]|uniref:uncharacterized protein n=1 Tax=Bacidia gigantensis TaxID=2732470 RepID=UPI001D03B338|nr:uncharacterized protein KY384_003684 [Bacidia gigantensis]KAG8532047.1 hypothetical protein KY384_003684 [Bacidia gigantensis]